jgi:hypothetical protein
MLEHGLNRLCDLCLDSLTQLLTAGTLWLALLLLGLPLLRLVVLAL